MTEPIDTEAMAEAARLLDDQTQQMMPIPVWLSDTEIRESSTESSR
jgi:hypothetical protein